MASELDEEPTREEFLEREETREFTISDKGRKRKLMKNEKPYVKDPVREMHEERKRIFIEQIQGMVRWRKKNDPNYGKEEQTP